MEQEAKEYKYMVCVSCMTYNHAPYIVDAMNGFTMQETNFPFVCKIIDDASADGEQEVIKKYLTENFDLDDKTIVRNEETDDYVLTFARHKTNMNCYFAVLFLKYNHYSIKKSKMPYIAEWNDNAKYIAMCEGDDYWIHPQKLQMQVSYMERNNCMLTAGKAKLFRQDKKLLLRPSRSKFNTDFESILLNGGIGTATCTTMYRNIYLEKYRELVKNQKWKMGDLPLYLFLSNEGKVFVFNEYLAVYRVLPESASHTTSYEKAKSFCQSIGNIQLFFAERYAPNLLRKTKKRINERLFLNAIAYSESQEVKKFFKSLERPSFVNLFRFLRFEFKC